MDAETRQTILDWLRIISADRPIGDSVLEYIAELEGPRETPHDTRVKLDCERCELNHATARLVEQVDAERAIAARVVAERDQALAALALIHAEPTYDAQTGAVISVLMTGFDGRKTLHVPE